MDLTGWTLSSMEDSQGRRGLWYRRHRQADGSEHLELCGGREGDDHYLYLKPDDKLTKAHLDTLIDLLSTQAWVRSEAIEAEALSLRGRDAVVDYLLEELNQCDNTELHLTIDRQKKRITELLRALAKEPALERFAVLKQLQADNEHLRNRLEGVLWENAALKCTLSRREHPPEADTQPPTKVK